MAQLLDDCRKNLASLGLVRVAVDGHKYWGLIHDVLGRLLLNAVFHDFTLRDSLGFGVAKTPEHFRLLVLSEIATNPALGTSTEAAR